MGSEIVRWWLVVQCFSLVGLPLTGLLLRALPDRGYAHAKALGLLLTGYVAWLLAMLGLAPFGPPALLVAAVVVAGVGVWLTGGPQAALATGRRFLQVRWRSILASEVLFLVALLAAVWMRAHDPVPWGTERPMDFAFFNAIQHSGLFPPNDPWLAGYSINYYYFGYLLMAAVAQLSGLDPTVAYNLALALIFALTAQGVAGMIANLMQLTAERRVARWADGLFPLLGVIFVLVAANQAGAVQVIVGDERAVALDGPQLVTAVSQAVRGFSVITLPYQANVQDFGTLTEWTRQDKGAAFNWWWPSRALWDQYADGERNYTITEFPLFSFRLGDMHPHIMALPFGLLAVAVALALLARPTLPGAGREGWATLLLTGLVLGSLYAINSWDLPTYLLLYTAALALLGQRLGVAQRWRTLGWHMLIVIAAAYLLFLPFHLTFHSLVGGAKPLVDLPLIGRLTSIIGLYLGGRSGLHAFLIIFGLSFVPILLFVYGAQATASLEPTEPSVVGSWERGRLALSADDEGETPSLPGRTTPYGFSGRWTSSNVGNRYLPLLPPLLLVAGLVVGFPLLMLVGLGLLAGERAWRLAQQPGASFGLLLAALGCAVLFGVEMVYIRDVFEGLSARMNTVFKFYYQIWLLWGTLAPFALWWGLHYMTGRARFVAWGAALLTAVLLVGSLVYPWLTLRELGQGMLVGLTRPTPREQTPAGAASIRWLRQAAATGSVVLEAVAVDDAAAQRCGGSYNGDGYGGVSAATGLPTVLGWAGHQQQWRGGDAKALAELGPRCAAVDTIYSTTDPAVAQALLAQYRVNYIYVGDLERRRYSPEALAKFSALGEVVFEQDEVTILRVGNGGRGIGDGPTDLVALR